MLNPEQREQISSATQRYLEAFAAFQAASYEFNKACSHFKEVAPAGLRLVVACNRANYLVTTDSERNFEVEKIEVI